jgi:hypothetical protein
MPIGADDERIQGRKIQLLQPVKGMKGALVVRTKVPIVAKAGFIKKGDSDQLEDPTASRDHAIENPFTMTSL